MRGVRLLVGIYVGLLAATCLVTAFDDDYNYGKLEKKIVFNIPIMSDRGKFVDGSHHESRLESVPVMKGTK